MNQEQTLRKKLFLVTIFAAIVAITMFAITLFMAYFFKNIQEYTLRIQVSSDTSRHIFHIQQKFESDFETLNTLAAYLDFVESDPVTLTSGLVNSNKYNGFVRMSYFRKSGESVDCTLDGQIFRGSNFESINPIPLKTITLAFEGKEGISQIYHDDFLGVRVFIYAVPVYHGDKVASVLVGTSTLDFFNEVIAEHDSLCHDSSIHIIDKGGNFFVRSKGHLADHPISSIYDEYYISDSEKSKIKNIVENGLSGSSKFKFNNVIYRMHFEPIGVNDWIIFCVSTMQELNDIVFTSVTVLRITALFMFFLMIIFVIYFYRQIYSASQNMIYIAYHDSLTGAFNMEKFTMLLEESFKKFPQSCVVVLNFRQFKFINEIFGREQADNLLRHTKETIEKHLRQDEYCARSAADYFYIFLTEGERTKIERRLTEITAELRTYSFYEDANYRILPYCGVVLNSSEVNAENVYDHAMMTIHKIHKDYSTDYIFYDDALYKKEMLENRIVTRMHSALQNGEFKLFLQPKIDLRTKKIGGAEALVRWQTLSGETIFPDQFIPLFEKNGFCVELDLYMVESVCKMLRAWIDSGITPVPISVNQTKLLFFKSDYPERLKKLIERYQIPSRLITLEILEGLAMSNVDELNQKVIRLRELGFLISMDDFGAGYSSLNILGKLKINELKLDRAFLMEATGENSARQKIVMEEVVAMAHKLGIKIVVEGVETSDDDIFIRSLDCNYGQGYFYSRPISASDFSKKFMAEKN